MLPLSSYHICDTVVYESLLTSGLMQVRGFSSTYFKSYVNPAELAGFLMKLNQSAHLSDAGWPVGIELDKRSRNMQTISTLCIHLCMY